MSERFFYGRDSEGNVVFKLSKPSFDASTTADINLHIGGQKDTPQLVTSGTLNLIAKKVEIVDHEDLQRNPIVFARTIRAGDHIQEPYNTYGYGDGGIWYLPFSAATYFLSEQTRQIMYQIFTRAG